MGSPQEHPTPAGAIERVVLCFDGTWNTPEDQTSVSRIYAAVGDVHSGCRDQLKFYDAGVGTTRGSKIAGGALGWGLDENILQGYCWLVDHYVPHPGPAPGPESDGEQFQAGPALFVFGFSRGAYTARSLAGLINRCGIVRKDRIAGGVARTDSDLVRRAWDLYREPANGRDTRKHDPWHGFRAQNAWNVKVHFLGVWDTVGALGVPMVRRAFFPFWRGKYGFHDTHLGRTLEHAYHAVAIDEHRKDYRAALWTGRHPFTREVEQRWFPGAHANVGGGYEDDTLPEPPLRWIADKARALGLRFIDEQAMSRGRACCKSDLPADFRLKGDEHLGPPRDSYAEFLFGAYRLVKALGDGRHFRPMLLTDVGETVDATALLKWAADARYRPRNLAYAGRSDVAGDREADATPA